jgi:diguanylate cyclase (GGDEF)-like protein
MDKFKLFVCENYFPEIANIIEGEKFEDVIVTAFPSMCEKRENIEKTDEILEEFDKKAENGLVLCSDYCEINKLISKESQLDVYSANNCLGHLLNKKMLEYIIGQGGYIIGSGWLKNWKERMDEQGFDRETARNFYHEFCKHLLYFDTGIDSEHERDMTELSQYLDLPFIIIPLDLEKARMLIRSFVYEWRLNQANRKSKESIQAAQAQCAEYSAIFDMMGKIAAYTDKRETIKEIKQIFTVVFGAQDFRYWVKDKKNPYLPEKIVELIEDKGKDFLLLKDQNRFCIKIHWNEKFYGVIDVGRFLFPKYIEKYLNFAMEIVAIAGLALSNIDQFNELAKSEQKLQYMSFHDALTGLCNRTYVNDFIKKQSQEERFTVFMFDVDNLKYTNDHFGHSEGDRLIKAVADILKESFRETDIVARIGGDEFVGILKDQDVNLTNDIKNRVEEEITKHNINCTKEHLKVGLSMGFAMAENEKETIEALMTKADKLMYKNKAEKRI